MVSNASEAGNKFRSKKSGAFYDTMNTTFFTQPESDNDYENKKEEQAKEEYATEQ